MITAHAIHVEGNNQHRGVNKGTMQKETKVEMLGESENYAIWLTHESEPEEVIYHIEFGNITLHLFEDEWEEFTGVLLQSIR